ncbi:hypothetical protein HKD37_07G018304 [Glycine soja]
MKCGYKKRKKGIKEMRQLQGVERRLRGLLEVSGGTTTLIPIGESNLSTMKEGSFIERKIEERLFLFLTKVTVRPLGLRIGMASTDTAPPKVDFDSHKAQIGGLKVAVVRSCLGVLGILKEKRMGMVVAPKFGCKINPLNVLQEDDAPKYWCGNVADKDNEGRTMISKINDMLQYPAKKLKLFEPRCSDGAKEAGVGFMKRPCLFVVMDDLKVIPMTTTSSIEYLQKLEEENVELDDLVEIRKRHEEKLKTLIFDAADAALSRPNLCNSVEKTSASVLLILYGLW